MGYVWGQVGARREITFTGLAPGTYELSARGRNSYGIWSELDVPLTVNVIPPFWITLWFRGAVSCSSVRYPRWSFGSEGRLTKSEAAGLSRT